MVFDTRGRRRHVIKVVYAILALLMGASLFLVVGPFNLGELVGGGTTNAAKVLDERVERLEGKLQEEPDNETLLLSLVRARVAAGNAKTETDPQTGARISTPESFREVQLASEDWNRYLKQTDEPNPSGAQLMAGTLFSLAEVSGNLEETEARLDQAVTAQRIATEARPSVGLLTALAAYEYFAGDFAAGDATAKEAQAKAPKAEAKEVKKQLSENRQAAKSFESQKKEFAKQEKERGKEALQNPLGGLGSGAGALGQ
jgi:hypothetical protein